MLITGMVPTLFNEDEKENICGLIRIASKDAGCGTKRFVLYLLSIDDCFMADFVLQRLLYVLITLPFCLKRSLPFLCLMNLHFIHEPVPVSLTISMLAVALLPL